jgi:hypothetical protein
VEFGGLTFKPTEQGSVAEANGKSELRLDLPAGAKPPALPVGNHLTARVALEDGRTIRLSLIVESARPAVTVMGKADVLPPNTKVKSQLNIKLASQDDLPVSDALRFSLKSAQAFPRNGAVEIASPDGSLHTTLSLADSSPSLILESPDMLLGTLQPMKAFGPSAFGPIRLRPVTADGSTGDWLPLVTLVRLPTLVSLSCPQAAPAVSTAPAKRPHGHRPDGASAGGSDGSADAPVSVSTAAGSPGTEAASASDSQAPAAPAGAADKQAANHVAAAAAVSAPATPPASCTLSGEGLYFIDSVSTDDSFTDPTRVPEGFVGTSLAVPPPTGAVYYLRLRDDPANIDTVTLPAGPL